MKNFKWWLVGFLSLGFWLISLYAPDVVRGACVCSWSKCNRDLRTCSASFPNRFYGVEYTGGSCTPSSSCQKLVAGGNIRWVDCSACAKHGYGDTRDGFSYCVESCGGGCIPSCSPACGQDNGCDGTCSNAARGEPGVPTLSPGDGESVEVVSIFTMTVSWSRPGKANRFELELYPADLRGTEEPCEDETAHCEYNMGALSYTFNYEPVEYYYRVRAVNTDCGEITYGQWAEATFTMTGAISGRVRWDPANNAQMSGGRCALIGAPPMIPGEGSQVVVDGSYSSPVGGGRWDLGWYSVLAVPLGPLPVVLVPGDSQWNCTCPENCRYTDISAPIPISAWSGLYFFMTDQEVTGEAWFQGVGGNFHADGGNLRVNIPSSCSGVCEPYLITEDVSGTTGAVSYDGGGLDLGDFGTDNISENDDDWQLNTSYEGLQTKYNYFARILEDDPDGIEDWLGGEPDDRTTGVFKGDGISQIIGGEWTIDDETAVVLLVPNDIVIDVNIDVEEGGFLAIISSGDITIGDNVTNVEGVYIADGAINTCQSSECGNISGGETVADRQLVLEGIFTGWGGVGLRRDFGTTDNNTNPAELFIYRPDLQTNAYKYLLRPHFTWVEVAP